jgi:octanoyl-[GcvH]:protein N-octanoyltransferase
MPTETSFLDIFSLPPRWRLINEPIAENPALALRRDTELLREVALTKRGATARLWEVPQCLVVTKKETRFLNYDHAVDKLSSKGWPVIVRDSGGTSVPLHPGILNFSLIFPQTEEHNFNLDAVYMALCTPIQNALMQLGLKAEYGETPGSYCDGRYNLNIEGLKVTGTAQKIMLSTPNSKGVKQGVLAQAMLMVEADAMAGTDRVNSFYRYAGNERRFDPQVATSIARLLADAQPAGALTLQLRQLIADEFSALVNEQ